ncbi:MAG: hypothetical protein J6A19_03970 [Oscillospiraceae bacterium]|nr:hypothetical protein [Oscillospiraceae bacterium]
MKKRILAALVASAAVLSFAGCSSNNESSTPASDAGSSTPASDAGDSSTPASDAGDSSTPAADAVELKDDGETLSILTWEENSDTVKMVEFFLKEKGYDASKVTIVPVGQKGENARDGYKQYLKGEDDADLMVYDADWVADYINDDNLTAPYSAIGLSPSDFSEAFSYTLSWGTSDAGVFKAASFQATPGGFVYRADLAKEYLGVTTPEEMQEKVKDWDTFQATGATLYEASGGKTSLQATEGGLWQVFQANRTQPWVVDGKLVMDTAEDFYDIAKSMKDNNSLAGVPQWDQAWYNAVMDGTALGDFVPTWGLTTTGGGSILENFTNKDEELGKNMAICEGPSGWFWGGSYFGVSNKCDNKTLAKEFIEFYCKNADSMKAYAAETGDFMNNKTVMSEATISNKYLNGQNHYEILVKVLDNLDLNGKITKYDSVIKAKFNDSVNGYLDGTYATKEDAIAFFKGEVATAYPELIIE